MITILSVIRDPLPPTRPDVLTLFGKSLQRLDINSILVGQFGAQKQASMWGGGKLYISGKTSGAIASILTPLRDMYSVIKAFSENTINFVQVRDKIPTAILCGLIAKITRLPFIYWMSFPIVEGHEIRAKSLGYSKGPLVWFANNCRAVLSRWAFYRMVLPWADHIFVQSEAMRDWLSAKGIEKKRMTAVPMGVDTEVFQRNQITPVTDSRLDGRRVITYMGVLGKARNSIFLLDIVIVLKEIEPRILLLLAGDAPSEDERSWIREEIAKRNLQEYVLLTGWMNQDQVLQYVVRAEIGLSPIPRGELFDVSSPTKLVEYLALGIPSVANDIPDQQLVIERSNAGICVPMQINAFCDAILQLLKDDGFYRTCAENGPCYVNAERSYEALALNVAQTYRMLLRKS